LRFFSTFFSKASLFFLIFIYFPLGNNNNNNNNNRSIFIYEDFLKDDIFGLCLKLDIISYRITIYLEGFWFSFLKNLEDFFFKIIFLHGEIFEFP
jgi:hypothetical protein